MSPARVDSGGCRVRWRSGGLDEASDRARGVAERGRAFQRGAGQSAAHLRVRLNHGASDITQSLRPSSASRLVRAARSVLLSLAFARPPAPSLPVPRSALLRLHRADVSCPRSTNSPFPSFVFSPRHISLSLFVRVARCANACVLVPPSLWRSRALLPLKSR